MGIKCSFNPFGVDYTETPSTIPGVFSVVTYGDGKYVTFDPDTTKAAYSYDAINWTEVSLPISSNWISATYGNGMFVVIPSQGTKCLYSTDAINWNEGTLNRPEPAIYNKIVYGNGAFVIFMAKNYVMYSTDAINWDIYNIPVVGETPQTFSAAEFNGNRFIALSDLGNVLAYSSDGINWNAQLNSGVASSVRLYMCRDLTDGNNTLYCLGGAYPSPATVIKSTDGLNWELLETPYAIPIEYNKIISAEDCLFFITGNDNKFRVYNMITQNIYDVPTNGNNKDFVYNYNKSEICLVGNGTNDELISTNYILPTNTRLFNDPVYSITYGDKFVAVCDYSNKSYYSENGIDWIERNLHSTERWKCVMYADNKYVASSVQASTKIAYSSDGINWSASTIQSGYWNDLAFGNGKWVAIRTGSNVAAYSTNAINWNYTTLPTTINWDSVCFGNGKFVATANSETSTNVGAISTDGITWNSMFFPINGNWVSITYGNGMFVVISYNSNVSMYSINGTYWHQTKLPSIQNWYSVTYGNGMFVAIAESNIAAYSTDGINWKTTFLTDNITWKDVVYGNGTFIAVGNNTTGGVSCNLGL